jgi:hypothetical protein
MAVTQSLAEHQLPFDVGFAPGVSTYLRRVGVYGMVLASNLGALAAFYLVVRFPNVSQGVLVAAGATSLVWSLIVHRRMVQSLRHDIALRRDIVLGDTVLARRDLASELAMQSRSLTMYMDRLKKFEMEGLQRLEKEEGRLKREIERYESEARLRIQKEVQAAQQEVKSRGIRVSAEEMLARLQLFHLLEEIGLIPVWNSAGNMTVLRTPAGFNWRQYYDEFVAGEGISDIELEARYLKPPPILNAASSKSIANLWLACALIADAARLRKPLPEYLWKVLTRLEGVRTDFNSFRVEGHEVIFRAWVPGALNQEVVVWLRVVATGSVEETRSIESKLLDAMGAESRLLRTGGLLELGSTALAVIGESESEIHATQRIRP